MTQHEQAKIILSKQRADIRAKRMGCRVEDYDVYQCSRVEEMWTLVSSYLLMILFGAFIGVVIILGGV